MAATAASMFSPATKRVVSFLNGRKRVAKSFSPSCRDRNNNVLLATILFVTGDRCRVTGMRKNLSCHLSLVTCHHFSYALRRLLRRNCSCLLADGLTERSP